MNSDLKECFTDKAEMLGIFWLKMNQESLICLKSK